MYQKIYLILFVCSASFFSTLYAQKSYYNQRPEFLRANSVWAFGKNAGLDFNNGSPVGIKTAMPGNEGGFSSVADPKTGKLLFYTNGIQCFDAKHQLMTNGDSLWGNGSPGGAPGGTAQGSCIVPVVDSPGKYYLFSLSSLENYPTSISKGWLFYSIVDMNLNNGLGNIVSGRKNIALDFDILSESMTAIPGDNCDVWLMVHTYKKDEIKTYHITPRGIDPTPVISTTSRMNDSYGNAITYDIGISAVSPDRLTIAMDYMWGVRMLGKFDPQTGKVSNVIQLPAIAGMITKACFSPDNSKLYSLSVEYDSKFNTYNTLRQFEISNHDSTAITNSEIVIFNTDADLDPRVQYNLRLYNDTIYTNDLNLSNGAAGSWISRINKPNAKGLACNFQDKAIALLTSTSTMMLGEDVVLPLLPDIVYNNIDTFICSGKDNPINIQAIDSNLGYTYIWNTGATTAKIQVSTPGTYWVTYGDGCYYYSDSFQVKDATPFTTITIKGFDLGATGGPFASYQWLLNGKIIQGATESTYTVSENGDYQVIITNELECSYTSEIYKVTNTGIGENKFDRSNPIVIYPNPAQDMIFVDASIKVNLKITGLEGKLIKEQSNTTTLSIAALADGIYLLHITDANGTTLKIQKFIKAK